jgi:adenylosuccinate synthase
MPVKLVIGLQHGDEGKGRIVDDLVQTWADVVVRFQGGGNAGHTVYDKEGNKFVTHILPVGILSANIMNIIAKGCVVDIQDLCEEIKCLRTKSITKHNLQISGLCPIIEPTHKIVDRLKYQKKLGTTAKGIGPAYSDFYARDSILIRDIVDSPEKALVKAQDRFYRLQEDRASQGETLADLEKDFNLFNIWQDNFINMTNIINKFVMSNEDAIKEHYDNNLNILLEGAQGSGLSIYSGNYPDVTSSAPTIGTALNATGLNHTQINEVIGVIKSYKTKVGSGIFPSLIDDGQEKILAKVGKEFGATTGRPRKCGWVDLDEIKTAVRENGVTHLCVVKTDVMTHIEKPKFYVNSRTYDIPKINTVSINDLGFNELINSIAFHTQVKKISYTTGPKRGEIVWSN